MNLPNKLTTMRMVIVIFLIGLLLFPYKAVGINVPIIFGIVNLVYFIGAIIFLIAAFTDYLDGYIARKYNLVTEYGKFMDPIADKLLVNSLLIILVLPQFNGQNAIPLILVVLMIGRDIIVDGFRLVAARQDVVLSASIFGKVKTVLQMITIVLYLLNDFPFTRLGYSAPPYVSLTFAVLATVASLLSGVKYIWANRIIIKQR